MRGIALFENLEAEIARHGLSKKELALKAGISQKSMSNKLSGRTEFTLSEMFSIRTAIPGGKKLVIDYLFYKR